MINGIGNYSCLTLNFNETEYVKYSKRTSNNFLRQIDKDIFIKEEAQNKSTAASFHGGELKFFPVETPVKKTDFSRPLTSKEKAYALSNNFSKNGIQYMIDRIDESKHYNSEEALLAFDYFRKKKTPQGESIIECKQPFEYMLKLDPASVESSNFDMLMSLVERGIVDKHVFEYIPRQGKMPPEIEKDIDKLYLAYDMGIKPIDMFIPIFKSEDEAITGKSDLMNLKGTYLEMKQGDVFQVEGEDFIRIKTSENKSEKLNISRDTYFKLFPPIERYASTQNQIGNCWELTGINSLLCAPDTRASVLRVFYEKGDDIIIKFPDSLKKEIRFKNGKMPSNTNDKNFSKGAPGVKMLEYADGVESQYKLILDIYIGYQEEIQTAKSIYEKNKWIRQCNNFLDLIKQDEDNNYANVYFDTQSGITLKKKDSKYDNALTQRRDGGSTHILYKRFGFKDAQQFDLHGNQQNLVQNFLKKAKSFDNYVISWASSGKGIEETIKSELGIVSNHGYRIKPSKVNNNGTIETFNLINPWGITQTELTYDEVIKYGDKLYIASK